SGRVSTDDFRRLVFDTEPLQGFRGAAVDRYLRQLSGNTGYITFDQFREFMHVDTNSVDNPLVLAELTEAFNEVDTNKDGFISREEAQRGITIAGERVWGISFQQMCHLFDDNGDGQLSLDEFLKNIKKAYRK
ncbi:unnamed protein product, partial [Adineta ricciae]